MSELPDDFSVELTSSARVAIVSAIWLDVSMMASVNSCERPIIMIDHRERFLARSLR